MELLGEMTMPDRSTYRMYEDERLIEEAKYNPNRELAIVLGERLSDGNRDLELKLGDAQDRAHDLELEAAQLDARLEEAHDKIAELELMLSDRERIIDELKKGN